MSGSFKKAFSGSLVGILSRVVEAVVRFLTLPMLLSYFGKYTYGLIELAISTNAYMQLLDMGMNMGTVKFFSQWLAKGKIKLVIRVSQSNVVFYGIIGLINMAVLLVLSVFAEQVFSIPSEQVQDFRWILLILGVTALVNWAMYTVNQLLMAYEKIYYVHLMSLIRAITSLISALIAIKFHMNLVSYFWLFSISNFIYIPLSMLKLQSINRRIKVGMYIFPKWYKEDFRAVYKYGVAIFSLGIFQFSASSLRPIILGIVSHSKGVLTDYRIIQNFVNLILTFGSIFIVSLLPASSKTIEEKNHKGGYDIVLRGTRYITFMVAMILAVIACLSKDILHLYVGDEYVQLSNLLSFSCLIVLIQIHLSPVASMFYAVGKTRALIYFTIPSTIISLLIVVFMGVQWGVKATVVSYAFYITMQVLFYYIYYIPKVLNYKSTEILLKGFIPGFCAAVSVFILYLFFERMNSLVKINYLTVMIKSAVIVCGYLLISLIFIKRTEVDLLLSVFGKAYRNKAIDSE